MKNIGYYRTKGECLENISNGKKCATNTFKIKKQLDSMKYIKFLSEKLNNNIFNSQFLFYEFLTVVHYDNKLEDCINIDCNYIFNILNYILKKFNFFTKEQKEMIIKTKVKLFTKNKMVINL